SEGLIDDEVASAMSLTGTRSLEPHVDDVVDGLHAYLARTPARLLGIYLPDLVGDRRPINQPGTIDEYPNWRVPMADARGRPVLLDELMDSPRARRLAHVVADPDASVTVASAGDQAIDD
ncbi:MAG: 4-alpha-glucanotransferase, partial [Acidothermaceae bacterium]